MKELVLRFFFSRKELYVVNHQNVGVSISFFERIDSTAANRLYELVCEPFARYVEDFFVRKRALYVSANRMKKVCLSKSGTPVNKERIVSRAGLGRHRHCCGVSKFVCFTDDEIIKAVSRI